VQQRDFGCRFLTIIPRRRSPKQRHLTAHTARCQHSAIIPVSTCRSQRTQEIWSPSRQPTMQPTDGQLTPEGCAGVWTRARNRPVPAPSMAASRTAWKVGTKFLPLAFSVQDQNPAHRREARQAVNPNSLLFSRSEPLPPYALSPAAIGRVWNTQERRNQQHARHRTHRELCMPIFDQKIARSKVSV